MSHSILNKKDSLLIDVLRVTESEFFTAEIIHKLHNNYDTAYKDVYCLNGDLFENKVCYLLTGEIITTIVVIDVNKKTVSFMLFDINTDFKISYISVLDGVISIVKNTLLETSEPIITIGCTFRNHDA